jgi:hypothetical protein
MTNYTRQFGASADYNCGTYGAGTYQNSTCGVSTGSGSPLDGLANTGYDVLLPIFLGVALIIAGAILFTKRWLRKRRQSRDYSVASN